MLGKLKTKAAELRREIFALHLATRDPRTPRHAKVLIVCVVAYALSPIDLIPDPIPVLGYLDDLLLLPLGIWLAIRMIPREVLQDCRKKAATRSEELPKNWWVAGGIVLFWLAALILIATLVIRKLPKDTISDARFGY